MIEQPPKPDVPVVPDPLKRPQPVNTPIPPGQPPYEDGEDGPEDQTVPPPTDPAPPTI